MRTHRNLSETKSMRVPSKCIIALLSTSTFAPCCSTSSSNFPFSSAKGKPHAITQRPGVPETTSRHSQMIIIRLLSGLTSVSHGVAEPVASPGLDADL